VRCFILFVASAHIALPVNLLRYVSWRRERTGAASRRRPCTPGLRPATSPLRGAFDLSLQASGRAEAASVQNTALSPHPCGLPRPSGNVSAMLRPPAPAVSAAPCPAAIHILGLDPVGRVSVAPPGKITAQQGCLEDNQCLPGGAALARTWGEPTGGPRRLGMR
jgi:hypothetical protein